MHSLPLIIRELRRTSRRPRTYRDRVALVSLGFVILAYVSFASELNVFPIGPSKGRAALLAVAYLLMFCSLVAGVFVTADCLSEDRREGTLGLLFLTPLRGIDILLGKLVSTSLNIVYSIAGLLPIFALTILLGGVSLAELIRLALALGSALFLSLATGLFVSNLTDDARKATTTGFGIVFFIALGPYIYLSWRRYHMPNMNPADFWEILKFSPLYTLEASGAVGTAAFNVEKFQTSLAIVSVLGGILFLVTAILLQRTFQRTGSRADNQVRPTAPSSSASSSSALPQSLARRAIFRKSSLDHSPFSWLVDRAGTKPYLVDLLGAAFVGINLWVYWLVGFFSEVNIFLWYFTLGFLKIWCLVEVVSRVFDERKMGTFELLLTSPLRLQGIVHGIDRALFRQFGRGFLEQAIIGLILYLTIHRFAVPEIAADFKSIYIPVILLGALDLWALKWMGLWSALKGRSSSRALGQPILRLLLLPWLLAWLTHSISSFSSYLGPSAETDPPSAILLWLAYGCAAAIGFGLKDRYHVLKHAPVLAMHGFDYSSAENEWLGNDTKQTAPPQREHRRFPWPRSLSIRVSLTLLLVLLTLISGGQLRRLYYEREIEHHLRSIGQSSKTTNHLAISETSSFEEAYRVPFSAKLSHLISRLPTMNQILSQKISFLRNRTSLRSIPEPASPEWQQFFQDLRDSPLYSGQGQPNQNRAALPMKNQGRVDILFQIIQGEINQRIQNSDWEGVFELQEKRLDISLHFIETGAMSFRDSSAAGLRSFQSTLENLSSRGVLTEQHLTQIETLLAPAEQWTSTSAAAWHTGRQAIHSSKDHKIRNPYADATERGQAALAFLYLKESGTHARDWAYYASILSEFCATDHAKHLYEADDQTKTQEIVAHTAKMTYRGNTRYFICALYNAVGQECDLRARLRLLKLVVSIEQFRMENQRMPATLSQLQPEDNLIDPYSGGPFSYRIAGTQYEITSAGSNRARWQLHDRAVHPIERRNGLSFIWPAK